MTEEWFHILWSIAERDPQVVVAIGIGVPLVMAFLFVAAVRRWNSFWVWATLTSAFYAFSQSFPENRDQWLGLLLGQAALCGVISWFWSKRLAESFRQIVKRVRHR